MSIFQKYRKIFTYLFCLMIVLFLLPLGLLIIYYFTGWEILLPISQVFTAGNKDVILLFSGAVVASFVGSFFSAWSHELGLEEERKQVASGFYQELTSLKIRLQNIQHDDQNRLLTALQKMIPIYSRDGLYFILRKEIYALENEIIEPLVNLYSQILQLADIQESLKIHNSSGYYSPQQIADMVNSINRDIEIMLPILEERKNRLI